MNDLSLGLLLIDIPQHLRYQLDALELAARSLGLLVKESGNVFLVFPFNVNPAKAYEYGNSQLRNKESSLVEFSNNFAHMKIKDIQLFLIQYFPANCLN